MKDSSGAGLSCQLTAATRSRMGKHRHGPWANRGVGLARDARAEGMEEDSCELRNPRSMAATAFVAAASYLQREM